MLMRLLCSEAEVWRVTDEDVTVLHRLGLAFTSAVGLDCLNAQQAQKLFGKRRYTYVGDGPKQRLTILAWQISKLRNAPSQLTLQILQSRVVPYAAEASIAMKHPT
jgi:hypothetical protein